MNERQQTGLTRIQRVLHEEAQALSTLHSNIHLQSAALEAACRLICSQTGEGHKGRLVCTGVGKAGLIARKVSATFASTGTPGFFLHPTEALHGDLGMLGNHDIVLAFSNSGTSEELLTILPAIARIGAPLLAICGNPASPLAQHADHLLDIGRIKEACPLGLAPTTTTTNMLALGDALALTVLEERGFTAEQYARFHPGGALGRKLMTCAEAMRSGEALALVSSDTPLLEALKAIGAARSGSAIVVNTHNELIGILTDGDLRRALTTGGAQILEQQVGAHATAPCRSIQADDLLSSALHHCAQYRINDLPVVDSDHKVVGLIDIQDLIKRGFDIDLSFTTG